MAGRGPRSSSSLATISGRPAPRDPLGWGVDHAIGPCQGIGGTSEAWCEACHLTCSSTFAFRKPPLRFHAMVAVSEVPATPPVAARQPRQPRAARRRPGTTRGRTAPTQVTGADPHSTASARSPSWPSSSTTSAVARRPGCRVASSASTCSSSSPATSSPACCSPSTRAAAGSRSARSGPAARSGCCRRSRWCCSRCARGVVGVAGQRLPAPPRRRPLVARLPRELAPRRQRRGLLRPVRDGVTAASHVVAGGGGAVLRLLAAAAHRPARARHAPLGAGRAPAPAPGGRGVRRRRDRRVGARDGAALRPRLPEPRLLRHRRPGAGAVRRRPARRRAAGGRAPSAAAPPARDRCRGHRGPRRAARRPAHDVGRRAAVLPRRRPRRQPRRGGPARGARAAPRQRPGRRVLVAAGGRAGPPLVRRLPVALAGRRRVPGARQLDAGAGVAPAGAARRADLRARDGVVRARRADRPCAARGCGRRRGGWAW